MKTAIILVILLFNITSSLAQFKYDSLSNFLGEDYEKYIGQELYTAGQDENFFGFVIDYQKDINEKGNVYKENINTGYSEYDSLVKRYFKVLDVVAHYDPQYQEDLIFLELLDIERGNIIYFYYDLDGTYFPFLVVGFFEKFSQKMLGESFVFSPSFIKKRTDIYTDKPITNEVGQKWDCIEVYPEYGNIILVIFKNKYNEKMLSSYKVLKFGSNVSFNWFTWKDAERYRKKFGVSNFNIILDIKLEIGFTKDMVRLSWGEPKNIIKDYFQEKWEYYKGVLTFDTDGDLMSIKTKVSKYH